MINLNNSKFQEILSKDSKKELLNILKKLEEEENSYYFLTPVDYKGLDIPDYPKIISNPMDLSTIKKQLKKSVYKKICEVVEDIYLIWTNCKTYNIEGSDIYNSAVIMEEFTSRLLIAYLNTKSTDKKKKGKKTPKNSSNFDKVKLLSEEVDVDESTMDIERPLSFTHTDFSTRINSLNKEGLARVVKIIQMFCPGALVDLDEDKWIIKQEFIDENTLNSLRGYIFILKISVMQNPEYFQL